MQKKLPHTYLHFSVPEALCCRIGPSNIYVYCPSLQIAIALVTTHAQEGVDRNGAS